ncbi:MAG: tripartite tricarboxylate transporter permease [Dehalococcoidia bacterium]
MLIDAFLEGLFQVLSFPPFAFMLVGMAIGFVVGILPGLGGATTLALMLPFIYTMEPVTAFAFLLGMHAVVATTGDVTSVLFGVPGEGTAAATILDGHPMAKKGEAGRALGAALFSSLVGALIGAFALALAIPVVRPLVLSFSSPEMFMLIVLGITFISALGGGSMIKAFLAGALGLLISMVGVAPITVVYRYTFGWLYLFDGLPLIPAVIGLFAVPEIVDLAVRGTAIAEAAPGKLGGVWQGIKDTFRHWGLTLRCSLLGTFIGIIPGLGGAVAQWVAYGHAVQSSPQPERFGKGTVEGVLAPGAANNSKEGGSLVPTVAFGVPGSAAMAILLGAFLILGLVPGPAMVSTNVVITFSMVWTLVVANIITVGIALLFLNQIARITRVKGTILIPFIVLLIFLGGFAARNSFGDLVSVLAFGFLGVAMVKLDWPRPPMILGIVLGRLAERKLYLSTQAYGAAFLTRPMVIGIMVLIVGAVLWPFWQQRRKRARQRS